MGDKTSRTRPGGKDTPERRAERVRPIVEEASLHASLRKVARQVGVSHTTLHNLLNGAVPSHKTLVKLERWAGSRAAVRTASGRTGGPEDAPASELATFLGQRAGLEQILALLDSRDLLRIAYSLAVTGGWSRDDLRQLDGWRDHILSGLASEG